MDLDVRQAYVDLQVASDQLKVAQRIANWPPRL